MLSPLTNPLQLPNSCFQASCAFDKEAVGEFDFAQLGLTLPERLATAMPKRKAEFLAGRYCAQKALKEMGADWQQTISIGEKREPLWPAGIIGSITHSKGFASAVVASTGAVRAIGIDSEALIAEKTANNVSSHILTGDEVFEANQALVDTPRQYLTLIFSAKESIFKCLYPLVQQYFDFRHAVVALDPDHPGCFEFTLLKDLGGEFGSGYSARGRYVLRDDLIHTAVILEC